MSLLKGKNLYRDKSQARESIPFNSAVRTCLFICLFHQNQAQFFLPCEAEGYCFKIIPLRDVSRQISRLQPHEDKRFPLVQLFLWAQEGAHFTPLGCSGRINHYNILFCIVKGIAMGDQHLLDFFFLFIKYLLESEHKIFAGCYPSDTELKDEFPLPSFYWNYSIIYSII